MIIYPKELMFLGLIVNPMNENKHDHLFLIGKMEDERIFGRFIGPNYYGRISGKWVTEVNVKLELQYYSKR